MPSLSLRLLLIVALVLWLSLVAGCAIAAETDPDGRLHRPSADPLADVLQLGEAHYYATPTVLIVDPLSGQPINDEDRHIWSNAYVAAGYAVVGPMLEACKDGNKPEEFDTSWDELRDFRVAIPDAIRELREEARRRVSAGEEDIQLVFPGYDTVTR